MRFKFSNIRIPVCANPNVKNQVCRQYHIDGKDLHDFKILRQAVDARKKNNVIFDFQVAVTLPDRYQHLLKEAGVSECKPEPEISYPEWKGTPAQSLSDSVLPECLPPST